MGPLGVSIVVPTLGRPSLAVLLSALAGAAWPAVPTELLIVDDRRDAGAGAGGVPVAGLSVPEVLADRTKVLTGRAAGPAAARNLGWRAARYPWVAFLDDDVVPDPYWPVRLVADLTVGADVGGVQGRVRVPLPPDRRPTDWERVTAGLADGAWITADMAYRRAALAAVDGFDERFPRAFREDAELAYRVRHRGWRLVRGVREVLHPVRPENPWVSVRTQRGNADDALLRRMYGPRWRELLDVPLGRRRRHAAVTAAGAAALLGAARAVRGPRGRRIAAAGAALGWAIGTTEFAAARIGPGPRTAREVATMAVTSAVIPPVAVLSWLRGWWRARGARPVGG